MKVIVNGESRELPHGTTVADLVRQAGLGTAACAAEVNGTLVPRRAHDDAHLADGDRVELVTLVGGG
ncbi:MAG: sulfur carrier protein ThiS [Phycisphaerales bacterium]